MPEIAPDVGGVYDTDTLPDAPGASVIDGTLVVQPFEPSEPHTPLSVYVAAALPLFVSENESVCSMPLVAAAAVVLGDSLGVWYARYACTIPVSAATIVAPSRSEAIIWIVTGDAVELPSDAGGVTLADTPVPYHGSSISGGSTSQYQEAGHLIESAYAPEALVGLLPPVKFTDDGCPPSTTTLAPAAALGLTHGSASGVRTDADAERAMFCPPAVTVAVSDTVFATE